jgi:diguanylate cyclase (GGDEF)-like protein
VVARLGGDEFAVLLAGVDRVEDARRIGEKIIEAARTPFSIGTFEVKVGASIGVALSSDCASNWRDLIGCADAALLTAKAAGKNRVAANAAAAEPTGLDAEVALSSGAAGAASVE